MCVNVGLLIVVKGMLMSDKYRIFVFCFVFRIELILCSLQAAFFNGVGYETWENVWGIWNSISQRDSVQLVIVW